MSECVGCGKPLDDGRYCWACWHEMFPTLPYPHPAKPCPVCAAMYAEVKSDRNRLAAEVEAQARRWAVLRHWANVHGHDLTRDKMRELEGGQEGGQA